MPICALQLSYEQLVESRFLYCWLKQQVLWSACMTSHYDYYCAFRSCEIATPLTHLLGCVRWFGRCVLTVCDGLSAGVLARLRPHWEGAGEVLQRRCQLHATRAVEQLQIAPLTLIGRWWISTRDGGTERTPGQGPREWLGAAR